MSKCQNDDCVLIASFGNREKNALFCAQHRLSFHVNVTARCCKNKKCDKQATYGKLGTKRAEFCAQHGKEIVGYINVVEKRKCISKNCKIHSTYGKKGSKKPTHCETHGKVLGFINIVTKRCRGKNNDGEECNIIPTYGTPGTSTGIYCKTHVKDFPDYVNVKDKICESPNCYTRASYGKKGTKTKRFCGKHAMEEKEDYINLHGKLCIGKDEDNNCSKRPTFGKKGTTKPQYCGSHRPDDPDIIDVLHKHCEYKSKDGKDQCYDRARYGKKGTKKATFCRTHIPDNTYVDVKHKTCKYVDKETGEKCSTRCHYGMPKYSPEYCVKHKTPQMIKDPTKAKDADYKLCEYCGVEEVHYDQLQCPGCKKFQKIGKTQNGHTKELIVKALLDKDEIKYTHDKQVAGGCSRRRPDFVINTKFGAIILEVDENQHNRKNYPCDCELVRMKQIYFDCGIERILFIRYNPDKYISSEKIVSKIKREKYLMKYLKEKMEIEPENVNYNLGSVYLFYDGFISTAPEIETFDPMVAEIV